MTMGQIAESSRPPQSLAPTPTPALTPALAPAPAHLGVFDIFRIGIGPSSSHTVGPMLAARAFAEELLACSSVPNSSDRNSAPIQRIRVQFYGSLGATGKGHSSDRAVLLGLSGYAPDTVESSVVEALTAQIHQQGSLRVCGQDSGLVVPFNLAEDLQFCPNIVLSYHVNALQFTAWDAAKKVCLQRIFYSIGGGFVMRQTNLDNSEVTAAWKASVKSNDFDTQAQWDKQDAGVADLADFEQSQVSLVEPLLSSPSQPPQISQTVQVEPLTALAQSQTDNRKTSQVPYPFTTGAQLLHWCELTGLRVSDLVRANEESQRSHQEVNNYLDSIATAMSACVKAGCATRGVLPGGLGVTRRAALLAQRLSSRDGRPAQGNKWACSSDDPMRAMEWVNLFALAVNEENAAGHRVVTAPTNGAAGVVPAVLGYLENFCPEVPGTDKAALRRNFLLVAGAIGVLIKTNASIAGAEVGCQGEVGSAASMAAAGLADALGGSAQQVENAAEIAMEHNLGLTCDPVGGLVQIPCIERNAIAAVKAINAARMALWGDGRHAVSLDAVIETMRQTGKDMLEKYKETAGGGLAVNVVEC